MAKRSFVIATVVLIAGLSVAAQQPRPSQPSIQGVWRVVEETAGGRTITDPNLGFIIHTAKHYALVRETGNRPRPDVSDLEHS